MVRPRRTSIRCTLSLTFFIRFPSRSFVAKWIAIESHFRCRSQVMFSFSTIIFRNFISSKLRTCLASKHLWKMAVCGYRLSPLPARSLYFWEVKMSKSSSNFGWYWDLFKLNGHMIKHGLDWVGQISCTKCRMYQMCESLIEFLQRIC